MKKLFCFLFCISVISLSAQKKEADSKFNLYQYSEAIPLYKDYLRKKPNDYKANKNLVLAYKFTNNIQGAIEISRTLITLTEAQPEDWYTMVQFLRISGNLSEARIYAIQYQLKAPGEKADNLIKSIDMYDVLMADKDNYELINKTAQYPQSTFSPILYQGGLIVTSEASEGEKNDWTGRGYTKLFLADLGLNSLIPFGTEVMTKFNDGPATISQDGKTLYFTSINKNTLKEEDINRRKLQITSAVLKNGKWETTEQFRFNNNKYNLAHPALSFDGKMLVFSSDMPGGKGGMDLYSVVWREDNTWSDPVNIALLNTSENELFPGFDAEGNLYFSSDGIIGLGGLDIFKAQLENGQFTIPMNLKAPINSVYDDFSLCTGTSLENGYLSTNRFGSSETDDIAYFSKKIKAVPTVIQIKVLDKYTSIPLPYTSISLKDDKNNIVFKGMTDIDGILTIEDMPSDKYRIQGMLNDITSTADNISPDEFNKPLIEKTLTHNDPRFTLSGLTINTIGGPAVAGVTVLCENLTTHKTTSLITGEDGKFFFQLEQASDYKIYGEKPKWLSSEAIYETTKGLDRSKDLYVKITLSMQQPTVKSVIRLDKIYYDYDKCDIKPRSAEELDRLVKLMNDYPDMIIELSSHTDSRGSKVYNTQLSQCRADSALAYLVAKGISETRIFPRGYGETKPVNECIDGVECSDIKHQENRRTEFRIVTCVSCP